MKRPYDTLIDFAIDVEDGTYEMTFSSDWLYTEIFDFMVDRFSIDTNSIVEIRNTFIKRFKEID